MNERLKILRKALNMNQTEIGKKITITQAHISALEKGIKSVTERIISDYCWLFNVNEQWLRTGKGEVFLENDENIIAELIITYHLDGFDKTFITQYLQLDEAGRKTIKEYIFPLATQLSKVDETAASVEEEVKVKLAEYRQELEAEEKGRILSASAK